jgi:hypothetical protein
MEERMYRNCAYASQSAGRWYRVLNSRENSEEDNENTAR